VFIDGEPSFCAAARCAVHARAGGLCGSGWQWPLEPAAQIPVSPVGFGEDEALIDFSARSHTAYRC
jgi:type VI secretion system protein ImpG